jgi:subtilisin-like proprotein convertase family protein
MHARFLLPSLAALLPLPLTAATSFTQSWSSGFEANGLVPDGNPIGWSDSRTLSSVPITSLSDLNVSLTITGGAIGDLYIYLSNGALSAILLNRPGKTSSDDFGFSDEGFSITFDDSGPNGDSHLTLTGPTRLAGGSWEPDARPANPYDVLDTSPRSSFLSGFNSYNPNTTWTLFVADTVSGSSSTVTSWGLTITSPSAVPEPSSSLASVLTLTWALTLTRNRRRHRLS